MVKSELCLLYQKDLYLAKHLVSKLRKTAMELLHIWSCEVIKIDNYTCEPALADTQAVWVVTNTNTNKQYICKRRKDHKVDNSIKLRSISFKCPISWVMSHIPEE